MPILLHTTQRIRNKLPYSHLAERNVTSNTTLTFHYTAFLIYTRYKYESVSASLEEQKEIELRLIWIQSESHVNLNRAPRKLYLSPNPIRNETYFKSKWSQFQSQKSLYLYSISKIVRDKAKIVTDAWGIKPHFNPSVTHTNPLAISILSNLYLKIVMGDR